MDWIGTWQGGRVLRLRDKSLRFYIEKRIGKDAPRVLLALDFECRCREVVEALEQTRRLERVTCGHHDQALAELSRFRLDPGAYKTRKQHAAQTMRRATAAFDPATVIEFFAWGKAKRDAGELSAGHVERKLIPYVEAWALALGGRRPWREISASDLDEALKGWKNREGRKVALKTYTRWLRKVARKLDRKDDCTLDLSINPSVPEKNVRKKGYTIKRVEEAYRLVRWQVVRDMLMLKAKTGMHESEIARIAEGKGELTRVSDPSGIEGVLVFDHLKKGSQHAVSVDAETYAAAERLVERGGAATNTVFVRELQWVAIQQHGCGGVRKEWPTKRTRNGREVSQTNAVVLPCKKCKPVRPSELRHSFATWARTVGTEVHPRGQKGVDLQKVAEAMGHLQKRTTQTFYVGDRTPMMIRIPIELEHPDDPPLKRTRR